MFQRPGNQPIQVVVKQRPGCFGVGCGSILIVIALLVVIGVVNGTDKAIPTPGRTFAASIAPATTVPVAQATIAASPSATTLASTATPLPATPTPTSAPQIVTVKEDAVNLRQSADVGSAVVTLVPPGTDATVIGEDTTGPDGVTRYVHARVGNQEGYLRSDLVSEHRDGVVAAIAPTAPASAAPVVAITRPVSRISEPVNATATVFANRFSMNAAGQQFWSGIPIAQLTGREWLQMSQTEKLVFVLVIMQGVPYCTESVGQGTDALDRIYSSPSLRSQIITSALASWLVADGCRVPR